MATGKIITGIVHEIAEKTRENGFVYISEEELNKLWGEDMDLVSFRKMASMLRHGKNHILVARPCEVNEVDKKWGVSYVPSTYDAAYCDYNWLEAEAKKTPMLTFPKIDIPDELRFFSIRVLEIYRRCLKDMKPIFISYGAIKDHFSGMDTDAKRVGCNILDRLRWEYACAGLFLLEGIVVCPLQALGVPYVNG